MQEEEVENVEDSKYLGSTVQSSGECGIEVKKRVQSGWNGWRRMPGVLCNRRVPARVKGKVYKVAVTPAMLYGLEMVALTNKTGSGDGGGRVEDVTIFIRNNKNGQDQEWVHQRDSTGGTIWRETREEILRWYGHVWRKDDGYVGRRMLRMALPGKRKRGRPKRRFMNVVKEDMTEVEVTEEDTEDRGNWRWKIR